MAPLYWEARRDVWLRGTKEHDDGTLQVGAGGVSRRDALRHHRQLGYTLTVDTPVEEGGENAGFSPIELLLLGLAGCTGMDVISILKKSAGGDGLRGQRPRHAPRRAPDDL